jgi:hypothetical protein
VSRPRNRAPQLEPNRVAVAEEQIRCYELRLTGMSLDQIATATGIPRSTVHDRIQAEITTRVLPLAEEVRKLELDRLDRWQARLEERLDASDDPVKVVPVLVKVSERRCHLMGANAPEKIEATVTQVTQDDIALAELVAEAQAAAAVAESQLRQE